MLGGRPRLERWLPLLWPSDELLPWFEMGPLLTELPCMKAKRRLGGTLASGYNIVNVVTKARSSQQGINQSVVKGGKTLDSSHLPLQHFPSPFLHPLLSSALLYRGSTHLIRFQVLVRTFLTFLPQRFDNLSRPPDRLPYPFCLASHPLQLLLQHQNQRLPCLMRSISVDDLVNLLKKFVELVPYWAVAWWIGREGVGQGEEGEEKLMREG